MKWKGGGGSKHGAEPGGRRTNGQRQRALSGQGVEEDMEQRDSRKGSGGAGKKPSMKPDRYRGRSDYRSQEQKRKQDSRSAMQGWTVR